MTVILLIISLLMFTQVLLTIFIFWFVIDIHKHKLPEIKKPSKIIGKAEFIDPIRPLDTFNESNNVSEFISNLK